MKKFSFPLETVRRWRERHAEMEEARLHALIAEKQNIERHRGTLESELATEHRRVEDKSFDAAELARLDEFRAWVMREKQRLSASLAECETRIARQRAVLVDARRRFELIGRLKEKALMDWNRTAAKEQEDLAAELYLARNGSKED